MAAIILQVVFGLLGLLAFGLSGGRTVRGLLIYFGFAAVIFVVLRPCIV